MWGRRSNLAIKEGVYVYVYKDEPLNPGIAPNGRVVLY